MLYCAVVPVCSIENASIQRAFFFSFVNLLYFFAMKVALFGSSSTMMIMVDDEVVADPVLGLAWLSTANH